MGKIRRGNYVFITWKGDHSPRHVHVYEDGQLVVKWDLENDVEIKGEASRKLRELIARARDGGGAMRIRSVRANGRRRAFEVTVGSRTLTFPFAKLRLKPDARNPVEEVFADPELAREAFTYRLADGSEDTIHVDAVLEYNEDPDHMRELLLHRLTVEARKQLERSELPRREVIRRLRTSASQFYRLLDEANHTKSFGQLFDLFHVLGCRVEVNVTRKTEERERRDRS